MALHDAPSAAIAAVAGRRIDASDAQDARFPLENVRKVRAQIAAVFHRHQISAVVSSAACGADLIALEEAERLGIRRRIILPFSPPEFREKSVIDRPGEWGTLYDRLAAEAERSGDLIVLDPIPGDDDAAYMAATAIIVQEAEALAQSKREEGCGLIAITIWDGADRPGNDITEQFITSTTRAGFKQVTILTV